MRLSSSFALAAATLTSIPAQTESSPLRIISSPNNANWCEHPRPSREVIDAEERMAVIHTIQISIEANTTNSVDPSIDSEEYDHCFWRYAEIDIGQCEELFDDSVNLVEPQSLLVTTWHDDSRIFEDFICVRSDDQRRQRRDRCMTTARKDLKRCIVEVATAKSSPADGSLCEEYRQTSEKYCNGLADSYNIEDKAYKTRMARAQQVCSGANKTASDYCLNPHKKPPRLRTEHHPPVPTPRPDPTAPPSQSKPGEEIRIHYNPGWGRELL